jgi:hypothetical protein
MQLGTIISEVKFPSSLFKGQKITGTITLKNPLNEDNVVLLCEITTWDGNYYAAMAYANVGQSHTYNFPTDFQMRIPESAPDPTMPAKDIALTLTATAVGTETATLTETTTITIKLNALQKTVLGVPVWTWLTLAGAIIASTSIFVVKKKKLKK